MQTLSRAQEKFSAGRGKGGGHIVVTIYPVFSSRSSRRHELFLPAKQNASRKNKLSTNQIDASAMCGGCTHVVMVGSCGVARWQRETVSVLHSATWCEPIETKGINISYFPLLA